MIGTDRIAEELTPKQDMLVVLLASGINIAVAAKAAGIGEATAHRWLKLAHVQSAYRAAQQSLFDQALSLLKSDVDFAINGIKKIAKDEEVPANIRLRAFQIWLEQALQVHKMSDIEQDVAELKALVKSKEK